MKEELNSQTIHKNISLFIKQQVNQSNQCKTPQKVKKKSFIRKNTCKIPMLLNYSYVFKISQSLIINERALRQPETYNQSFMTNIFYFKSIQSIHLNSNYVSLNLKQIQNNQFPISYYTDRFKSFGDLEFYQLANTLQLLDFQYTKKIEKSSINVNHEQQRQILRNQLQEVLDNKKSKKIICFYSQPMGLHVTMNKIIISNELLQELGYSSSQITKQFLRYRHIFFQIFDSSFYRQIVKKASQRLSNLKCSHSPNLNGQTFIDYVFRVKSNEKGVFEQKLKAQIIFSKPHSNISLYQITKIYQNQVIESIPRKQIKNNPLIKQWEQKLIHQQITNLESIKYRNLKEIQQL